MSGVGGNLAQDNLQEVCLGVISAPIKYYTAFHLQFMSPFLSSYITVLCQETETSPIGARMGPDLRTDQIAPQIDANNKAPKEVVNCTICFSIIDVNNHKSNMRLQCNHFFHRSCIETWMREQVRL